MKKVIVDLADVIAHAEQIGIPAGNAEILMHADRVLPQHSLNYCVYFLSELEHNDYRWSPVVHHIIKSLIIKHGVKSITLVR